MIKNILEKMKSQGLKSIEELKNKPIKDNET
jgi:hypothetical protein